jgi:hypothetical protein
MKPRDLSACFLAGAIVVNTAQGVVVPYLLPDDVPAVHIGGKAL